MEQNFFDLVCRRAKDLDTLLCVGLDPKLPAADGEAAVVSGIVDANRRIIEATLPYVVCYKPNIAFFEAAGPAGLQALQRTLELIPSDVPVIIDAKRSDIGSTAEAYAASIFGYYGAHAVTLSPYMGRDAVDPFLAYGDRCVFMLARTSNPSAGVFQDIKVDGEPLFMKTAEECLSWSDRVGLVVAGNEPEMLALIRARFESAWLLAPGIGAQGGDAEEAVASGARADGLGILPVVVRGISGAPDPAAAAKSYRDAANRGREKAVRRSALSGGKPAGIAALEMRKRILSQLIETGCFRVGEFVLKSGKKSPFYIDLRRIISSPELLSLTAKAYASLLHGIDADRIAAIPVAALPFGAALSLETGKPMIFPRLSVKDHGTGNTIEGAFKPGETAVLLDDLITTGKSKLEAVEILRAQGIVVTDLIVLLERGAQGRKDMEAAGIRLHAYAGIEELLALCEEMGLIDAGTRERMTRYAHEE